MPLTTHQLFEQLYTLALAENLRRTHGVTQQQLAAALGVSFQMLQKYEKGTARISPAKLALAAHHLNLPLWAFLPNFSGP